MTGETIQLVPMLCVRCQNPLPARPDEVFWVCQTCGQGQMLVDQHGLAADAVHYSAGIAQNTKGKPVWVMQVTVSAMLRQTFSGNNSANMQAYWGGPRIFFIPAYTLPLDQLIDASVKLLRQPPALQEGPSPAPFFAVTVHPEDLQPLAEFIVLAVEADRDDKLKQMQFVTTLGQPELWILP